MSTSHLKNYTSGINADVTISRIERMLIDAGVTDVAKTYAAGQVSALMFKIVFSPTTPAVVVRLPANIEKCLDTFWADHCKTRSPHSKKVRADFRDQSARTAWKLQQDWVEVQLSLIRLNQQEAMQAFLPYVWDGTKSLYDRVKETGFRALLPAGEIT